MLLAAYNLVRFDHVSQLLNFRVLVPTKCHCCCTQVNDAESNLLAVEQDEMTVVYYIRFKTLLLMQLVTCFYYSYSIGAPIVSNYFLMM